MRQFAYRLMASPSPRLDGSGGIDHDIVAVYRDDPLVLWENAPVVPGYHKTFVLPADEVEDVMDMPDSTGTQRQAKNQAYKVLMIAHWDSVPVPNHAPSADGWTDEDLGEYMTAYEVWEVAFAAANDAAVLEAGRVTYYIETTLGQTFPVEFQLG